MRKAACALALAALVLAPGPAVRGRELPMAMIRDYHEKLRLAPRDSYLNYAIATIARREGIDLKREGIEFPLVPVVSGDPAERTDLFGLAVGAHAIAESHVQADPRARIDCVFGARSPRAEAHGSVTDFQWIDLVDEPTPSGRNLRSVPR